MEYKKTIGIIAAFFAVVLVSNLASAVVETSSVFWACFDDGDKIDFCNPYTRDRTCDASSGCYYCMSSYDSVNKCFVPGSFNKCNSIAFECSPYAGGGGNNGGGNNGGGIDSRVPIINMRSPVNGMIYKERNLLVDVSLNEKVTLSYIDILNLRSKWTNLCTLCSSFYKKKSFVEGENNISFRAVDSSDNEVYHNVLFFVDSVKPKINRYEPKNGFASGFFMVEFKEDNPKNVTLNYGNPSTGFSTKIVNIANDCTFDRNKKYTCNVSVDLSSFNGKSVTYYFNVTDIAKTSDANKPVILPVDTKEPIINSLNASWGERKLYVTLNISEPNFKTVEYIDYNSRRPIAMRVCSTLKNGICSKVITLPNLNPDIELIISDKAGNKVKLPVSQ
ncbi:TPA: hypothetical protein ENS27_16265 [bacterium]|nr:hypothetical protein [bacterium]